MGVIGSISIRDNASAVFKNLRKEQAEFRKEAADTRKELQRTWNKTYTAKVDTASATRKTDGLTGKVKQLGQKVVSPVIKAKDAASATISKVSNGIKTVGKKVASPVIKIKDSAASKVKSIKNAIAGVAKKVTTPVIKLKDAITSKVTKITGKLKAIGGKIFSPIVKLKDATASGISAISSKLKTLAATVAIPATIAATAVVGGAVTEGAALEQSIGGVETLFKDDAGVVKKNADAAFKTVGISANEYMEQVTSFSASLLNSLGGDTARAAKAADMAMVDMADNANKFGTDMDSIQNAYQGFAKQNYTMLDNLKLGYGGTKEEMQRLLKDAQKLTGVKYNIDNLSDVYHAIHAVQENLGVAGTTAKEASETFNGSFAAMKSSVKNVLGNMAVGGDVTGSMKQLAATASTFLFDNALPMIGNVCTALPEVIRTAVKTAAPKLKEIGGEAAGYIRNGLNEMFPTSMGGMGDVFFNSVRRTVSALDPIGEQLKGIFTGAAPAMAETLAKVFTNGSVLIKGFADVALPVMQTFTNAVQTLFPVVSDVITMAFSTVMPVVGTFSGLIQGALPVVENVIQIFHDAVAAALPVVKTIFQGLGTKIAQVVNIVTDHMGILQGVFETVSPILQSAIKIVSSVLQTAWNTVSPMIDLAISVFDMLLSCVEAVFPKIQSTVSNVWNVLEPIFGAITDGLSAVGNAVNSVTGFVGGKVSAVTGWVKSKTGGESGTKAEGTVPVGKNACGDNNWRGGLTWVGEEGAELVDLPGGSRILPHKESVSLLGQGGAVQERITGVVHNTIQPGVNEDLSPVMEILTSIDEKLKQLVDRARGKESGLEIPRSGRRDETAGSFVGSVTVTIAKLADKIVVRDEEDIDEVADKVAKKVLEVVVNMG